MNRQAPHLPQYATIAMAERYRVRNSGAMN
jgi:hypothetical protein